MKYEDMEKLYSSNLTGMKKSVIRELLKLTQNPEIISFAGGLPSPLTFPVEEIAELAKDVVLNEGEWALQYGATEGIPKFKEEIIKFLKYDNVNAEQENIIVTTASQQGLDLVGRLFINRGDHIILACPSYIGAISAFRGYSVNFNCVSLDDDGMVVDEVKDVFSELKKKSIRPKFIYTIPDFQNPAGVTLSLERRKELLQIAREEKVVIIEDSPYRQLRYVGDDVPSLYELDKGEGYVISLRTFSKILFPGLRLGWIMGHKDVIDKFVTAKQAMDLCTPPMSQSIAYEYMRRGLLIDHIKENIALYKKRREAMLSALERNMPEHKDIYWTKPDGGLFLWVQLPEYIDTEKMFMDAIKENVAYVIGSAFYANGGGQNTMRINFSYPSEEQIELGTKRLANVIKKYLK